MIYVDLMVLISQEIDQPRSILQKQPAQTEPKTVSPGAEARSDRVEALEAQIGWNFWLLRLGTSWEFFNVCRLCYRSCFLHGGGMFTDIFSKNGF